MRPGKDDPNRTQITVARGDVYYPGDVATPTGSLEWFKLMINSGLSRPGARFAFFDVNNFYSDTPLVKPVYVRVRLKNIPQEFIDEYSLLEYESSRWIYFEIIYGCYGIKQSGKLSNDLLRTHLEKEVYYKSSTTLGVWRHKCRPIQFVLIVNDFGVKYVGKQHAEHLENVFKKIS